MRKLLSITLIWEVIFCILASNTNIAYAEIIRGLYSARHVSNTDTEEIDNKDGSTDEISEWRNTLCLGEENDGFINDIETPDESALHISSVEELSSVTEGTFVLDRDLTIDGTSSWSGLTPTGELSFDGQGHKIVNETNKSLFLSVSNDCYVENLSYEQKDKTARGMIDSFSLGQEEEEKEHYLHIYNCCVSGVSSKAGYIANAEVDNPGYDSAFLSGKSYYAYANVVIEACSLDISIQYPCAAMVGGYIAEVTSYASNGGRTYQYSHVNVDISDSISRITVKGAPWAGGMIGYINQKIWGTGHVNFSNCCVDGEIQAETAGGYIGAESCSSTIHAFKYSFHNCEALSRVFLSSNSSGGNYIGELTKSKVSFKGINYYDHEYMPVVRGGSEIVGINTIYHISNKEMINNSNSSPQLWFKTSINQEIIRDKSGINISEFNLSVILETLQVSEDSIYENVDLTIKLPSGLSFSNNQTEQIKNEHVETLSLRENYESEVQYDYVVYINPEIVTKEYVISLEVFADNYRDPQKMLYRVEVTDLINKARIIPVLPKAKYNRVLTENETGEGCVFFRFSLNADNPIEESDFDRIEIRDYLTERLVYASNVFYCVDDDWCVDFPEDFRLSYGTKYYCIVKTKDTSNINIEMDKDTWCFTTIPNPEFLLGKNNNDFIHDNSTGGGFEGVTNYEIDADRFYDILGYATGGEIASIIDSVNGRDRWGGSCFGIAATQGMYAKGRLSINELSSYTKNDYYSIGRPVDDSKFLHMINYYYLSQFPRRIRSNTLISSVQMNGKGKVKSGDLTKTLQSLITQLDNEQLVEIGYTYNGGGHAVLAVTYTYDSINNLYDVLIVDCNSGDGDHKPSNDRYRHFYIKRDFSGFSYAYPNFTELNTKWLFLFDINKMIQVGNSPEHVTDENYYKYVIFNSDIRYWVGLKDTVTGKTLEYDGNDFFGTMDVEDIQFIFNDTISGKTGGQIIAAIKGSGKYSLESDGQELELTVFDNNNYVSLSANGVDKATINLGESVNLDGSNYDFDLHINSKEKIDGIQNALFAMNGNAISNVSFELEDNSIKMVSDEGLQSLIINSYEGLENKSKGVYSLVREATISSDEIEIIEDDLLAYSIVAKSGIGGNISPNGQVKVLSNGNMTFRMTPYAGHKIKDVIVDGNSVGTVPEYQFKNVTDNHTIEVVFFEDRGVDNKPVTGISVSPLAKTISIGESLTIKATVQPEDATDKSVIWTSSKPAVATVDRRGNVTGISTGKTIITVSANNGECTAKCVVTVRDYNILHSKSGFDPSVYIASYNTENGKNIYNVDIIKGQKYTLNYGNWMSSDPKIVGVNRKSGAIVAKKRGEVRIENTASDGSVYNMTVLEPELSVKVIPVLVGDAVGVSIKNTGNLPVSWVSSDIRVASVLRDDEDMTKAVISGVGKGKAKVYAYVNGKAFPLTVKVKDSADSKVLSAYDSISANAFQAYTLKYPGGLFQPSKVISWSDTAGLAWRRDINGNWTDLSQTVTITKSGKVIGNTATDGKPIIARGTDMNGNSVTLEINVEAIPVRTDIYMNVGQTASLKHSFVRNIQRLRWDYDNNYIGIADPGKVKAKIKGVAVGEETVSCRYQDVIYNTVVHVENPAVVTDSRMRQPKPSAYNYTLALSKGETYDIGMSGVYQDVLWKSSNNSRAFVDEYGRITARGVGKANLTTKVNGRKLKISVVVTE